MSAPTATSDWLNSPLSPNRACLAGVESGLRQLATVRKDDFGNGSKGSFGARPKPPNTNMATGLPQLGARGREISRGRSDPK